MSWNAPFSSKRKLPVLGMERKQGLCRKMHRQPLGEIPFHSCILPWLHPFPFSLQTSSSHLYAQSSCDGYKTLQGAGQQYGVTQQHSSYPYCRGSWESHHGWLMSTSHLILARSLLLNSWMILQQANVMTNSEHVLYTWLGTDWFLLCANSAHTSCILLLAP